MFVDYENKYLVNICNIPDIVLDSGNNSMSKKYLSPLISRWLRPKTHTKYIIQCHVVIRALKKTKAGLENRVAKMD